MIIELYMMFLLFSFALMTLGYIYDNVAFKVLGFALFALIHIDTLNNGLSYVTGNTIVDNGGSYTVTKDYDVYTMRTLSIMFIVVGIIGSTAFVVMERRSRNE